MRNPFSMRVISILMFCAIANAADHSQCTTIDGVQEVLKAPGVFIGDMHGTEQSPRFLRNLACHIVSSGRSLVIAMEYDQDDQGTLDTFLATEDETTAIALLTATPYWKKPIQDGRTSMAMRDALLAIRRYALAGGKVKLFAYDLRRLSLTGSERDEVSAKFIAQERSRNGLSAYWIIFGGNVHARKTKGVVAIGAPAGYEKYEPLGYLIRDWGFIHLNASYQGATFWGCRGGPAQPCGEHQLGPSCNKDCPQHESIRLRWPDSAYDGVYEVGTLTASPPVHQP